MSFRKVLFWVHLVAGVVAGSIIAIMCFTGALLAFEHEIVEWAERDARRIEAPPANAARLELDTLIARAQAAHPAGGTPSGITVFADPANATAISFGRDATYYVNPYTGEVRQPASTAVHDFMHVMVEWHRWLAMSGDDRPIGKAVTGASNTAFLLLGVTGLYLWWPRRWTWRVLKPSIWFAGARGRARDWNWHNVIGFWSLPVLLVLTASGMVISYRWAGNLVYRAFGEEPPQQQGPAAFASSPRTVTPAPDARPLSQGALFAAAATAVPNWESLSLRAPRGGGARGGAGTPAGAGGATGSGPRAEGGPRGGRPSAGSAQPITLTVREQDRFPTFASTTVVLNPYTGAVLEQTGFANLSNGRQARLWLRWLHVGQGFGWGGQLVAGLACIGGLVLVYTGFALAWRRFFPKRSRDQSAPAVTAGDPHSEPVAAGRSAAAPPVS